MILGIACAFFMDDAKYAVFMDIVKQVAFGFFAGNGAEHLSKITLPYGGTPK